MIAYDVVVVGGGPAGAATAGALARRGRSVALFERSAYGEPRAGETFGGEVASLLGELGAPDVLRDVEQVPFRAIRSAWGSRAIEERASITHPLGEGAHVDRAAFDARLVAWAEAAGASVRLAAGTCSVERSDRGVRVVPDVGDAVEARVFVDASGRGAPAGRAIAQRPWLACDRQVALVARARSAGDVGFDLLLESAEDGWWYSVPQADGALAVAFVTDSDLTPAGGRAKLGERFAAVLARTEHTAARVASLEESVRVVRADSGCLLPSRAPGFVAVGDAAMAIDPLAGNGVARALRSARDAAHAIDRILDGGANDDDGTQQRLVDYLDRRASFYASETRWPEAPFWARRRPHAWNEAPLTLAPETLLRVEGAPSPRELASVEALLPPRAIATVLELLAEPRPAHAAMTCLRDVAPLGDRRLLVGLQELVARGAVARYS